MSAGDTAKGKAKRAAKRGIKVRKIGATWWGQRWIEALEHLSRDYLNRLGRGRAYARDGLVTELQVKSGMVTAQVGDADGERYDVTLRIAMLPPALWQKAIEAMSGQAMFSAELLAARMPRSIDDLFRAAGHSLFLSKQRELETDCSCPDWANPCKHVAAVHYVLGEAFDRDPFLLFELRGRTRQQVLGALRSLRSSAGRSALEASGKGQGMRKNADVLLEKLAAASQRKHTAAVGEAIGLSLDGLIVEDFERPRAPLPALRFDFAAPPAPGALLKQLGLPPSWPEDDASFEALVEIYREASRMARDWALDAPPESSPESAP